jgi:hypothetical protein
MWFHTQTGSLKVIKIPRRSGKVAIEASDSLFAPGAHSLLAVSNYARPALQPDCCPPMPRAVWSAHFSTESNRTIPWTMAAMALILLTGGLAAACIPARRAAGVDPMVSLRSE